MIAASRTDSMTAASRSAGYDSPIAGLAQLVEQRFCKAQVTGSSPVAGFGFGVDVFAVPSLSRAAECADEPRDQPARRSRADSGYWSEPLFSQLLGGIHFAMLGSFSQWPQRSAKKPSSGAIGMVSNGVPDRGSTMRT